VKSEHCKDMWVRKYCATALLLVLGCVGSDFSAKADKDRKVVSPGIVSTIWAWEKEDAKVTLITLNGDPVPLAVQPDTLIAGTCVHCNMVMEVKAGQSARNCAKCACNLSNTECFVNKAAGKNGWADILKALPQGTALRVEYRESDKPASGLKRMTIDYKTALLPISSASAISAEDLKAAVKAVGGTNLELGDDSKRLLIHLKNDWTQDKETRLAKSLAQLGVDVAFPMRVNTGK
jgi:hypothetical protein